MHSTLTVARQFRRFAGAAAICWLAACDPSLIDVPPEGLLTGSGAGTSGATSASTGGQTISSSTTTSTGSSTATGGGRSSTTTSASTSASTAASGTSAAAGTTASSSGNGSTSNGGGTGTPTLTSLSPPTALAGAALSLTLNGSGFAADAVVLIQGQSVTPTSVTSTQLGADVPGALLPAGVLEVAVQNPGSGGGTSNTLPLTVLAGIQTVLGGNYGDNGPALLATLGHPLHGATDNAGNIYYAERLRHRIMRIDSTGTVRPVAGVAGVCGYTGNGGPASSAQLCGPAGLATDSTGNIYVADGYGQALRVITPAGTINAIVPYDSTCENLGNGVPASSASIGDAYGLAVAANGDIYLSVCGCGGNAVRKISGGTITTVAGNGTPGSTGDGAQATSAELNCPRGIALDGSDQNLYIAELDGNRVRKVALATGIIETVAGNGGSGFSGPGNAKQASIDAVSDVVLDANGNLYIASPANQMIFQVTPAAGNIAAYAGGGSGDGTGALTGDDGPAADAFIGSPVGLFIGPSGDLDFFNDLDFFGEWLFYVGQIAELRQVNGTGTISAVAGLGPLPDAGPLGIALDAATGVTVDPAGDVYASAAFDNHIWEVTPAGNLTLVAGDGVTAATVATEPAATAGIARPAMLSYDPTLANHLGGIYFADSWDDEIQSVTSQGTLSWVAGTGSWPAGCPGANPTSPPSGAGPGYDCYGDDDQATLAHLGGPDDNWDGEIYPSAVLSDGNGTLYVSEGDRVRQIDLGTGIITTLAGDTSTTSNPCGFSGDNGPATGALLCQPEGLALSPQGDLVVADLQNQRVRRINLTSAPVGDIVTIAGNGNYGPPGDGVKATVSPFGAPFGVAYDASGNLYVSDSAYATVSVIDTGGTIHQLAGIAGQPGFGGDGSEAQNALLSVPRQLAIGPNPAVAGQTFLYVSELGNADVRRVGPFPAP